MRKDVIMSALRSDGAINECTGLMPQVQRFPHPALTATVQFSNGKIYWCQCQWDATVMIRWTGKWGTVSRGSRGGELRTLGTKPGIQSSCVS